MMHSGTNRPTTETLTTGWMMHSGTNSSTTEVSTQFDNISCNQYIYMIAMFITFMVLYSIIKPYNSFFVINRHIARRDFILNDLFCGG
jgi:hypothetical protein